MCTPAGYSSPSMSGRGGAYKKDKYRRKGKCRRCCLGDRIDSIPCHILAILDYDDFEELNEFILFFKSSWCNSSYSSNRPITK